MRSMLNIPFLTGDRNIDNNFLSIKRWGNSLVNPEPPSTATSPGLAGQWSYDTDYLYVCVADDTWKRVALATW